MLCIGGARVCRGGKQVKNQAQVIYSFGYQQRIAVETKVQTLGTA